VDIEWRVLIVDSGQEEHEASARAEEVSSKAHEICDELGELVRLRRGDVRLASLCDILVSG